MSKKTTAFQRVENKFVVLEYSFNEILKTLVRYIPMDIFDENAPYTNIKTIYMEDEKYTIFQEYLSRRRFRFKIRFRNYGYNGTFKEDDFWAELKVKYRSVCYKKRFLFPRNLITPFVEGEDIFDEIKELNENTKGLKKIYKLMTKLIKYNNLKPMMITTYERAAFQNKQKNIRITVDKNIAHRPYPEPSKQKTLNAIVFESKLKKDAPSWYQNLENKLSLLPQKRFSKYATGINSVYFPARGIYNFYTNYAETRIVPKNIEKSLILLKKAII